MASSSMQINTLRPRMRGPSSTRRSARHSKHFLTDLQISCATTSSVLECTRIVDSTCSEELDNEHEHAERDESGGGVVCGGNYRDRQARSPRPARRCLR